MKQREKKKIESAGLPLFSGDAAWEESYFGECSFLLFLHVLPCSHVERDEECSEKRGREKEESPSVMLVSVPAWERREES